MINFQFATVLGASIYLGTKLKSIPVPFSQYNVLSNFNLMGSKYSHVANSILGEVPGSKYLSEFLVC